jgi:hypothetical protein
MQHFDKDKRRSLQSLMALSATSGLALAGLSACGGGSDGNDSGAIPVGSATFRVVFISDWSAANFPTGFVPAAHFSGLVGAVHNASVQFWAAGGQASAGIKQMAETGVKAQLIAEADQSLAQGTTASVLSGAGNGQAGSQTALQFTVTPAHPLLTLVSMIAPSSDWFVGVAGLPLYNNGQWLDALSISLKAYDAGTAPAGGQIGLLSTPANVSDFEGGVHRTTGRHIASFVLLRLG